MIYQINLRYDHPNLNVPSIWISLRSLPGSYICPNQNSVSLESFILWTNFLLTLALIFQHSTSLSLRKLRKTNIYSKLLWNEVEIISIPRNEWLIKKALWKRLLFPFFHQTWSKNKYNFVYFFFFKALSTTSYSWIELLNIIPYKCLFIQVSQALILEMCDFKRSTTTFNEKRKKKPLYWSNGFQSTHNFKGKKSHTPKKIFTTWKI